MPSLSKRRPSLAGSTVAGSSADATCGPSGAATSFTLNVFFSPKRMTSSVTVSPGLCVRMMRCSVLTRSAGLPSAAMMTSPGWMPASFAGLSVSGLNEPHVARR